MPISNLPTTDALTGGDTIAVGSLANGDDRKSSLTLLTTWLQSVLTFTQTSFTTQYSTPLTGATVAITPVTSNTHLIITPAGTIANLTLTIPIVPGAVDAQEVLVNSTQAVSTLTISVNGATAVIGAPTSLNANDYFRLKYDILMTTWYRVG